MMMMMMYPAKANHFSCDL